MKTDEVWVVFCNHSMSIVSVHADEHMANEQLKKVFLTTKLSKPEQQYCVGKLSECLDWLATYYYKFNNDYATCD